MCAGEGRWVTEHLRARAVEAHLSLSLSLQQLANTPRGLRCARAPAKREAFFSCHDLKRQNEAWGQEMRRLGTLPPARLTVIAGEM